MAQDKSDLPQGTLDLLILTVPPALASRVPSAVCATL